MAALAEVKHEWKMFRRDEPGHRFKNHRTRMREKSRSHMAVAMGLGILLLAVGVVLLFMPGPGLLLIMFGLALVSSHSERLGSVMDRAEPKLRRTARRTKRRWRRMPGQAKLSIVLAFGFLAGVVALLSWQLVLRHWF